MIRDNSERKLQAAKVLMESLELPNYEGGVFKPYGYEGLSIMAFEERCRVINSLLMDVRKSFNRMIYEEVR